MSFFSNNIYRCSRDIGHNSTKLSDKTVEECWFTCVCRSYERNFHRRVYWCQNIIIVWHYNKKCFCYKIDMSDFFVFSKKLCMVFNDIGFFAFRSTCFRFKCFEIFCSQNFSYFLHKIIKSRAHKNFDNSFSSWF
jgi:hypothetical protein